MTIEENFVPVGRSAFEGRKNDRVTGAFCSDHFCLRPEPLEEISQP